MRLRIVFVISSGGGAGGWSRRRNRGGRSRFLAMLQDARDYPFYLISQTPVKIFGDLRQLWRPGGGGVGGQGGGGEGGGEGGGVGPGENAFEKRGIKMTNGDRCQRHHRVADTLNDDDGFDNVATSSIIHLLLSIFLFLFFFFFLFQTNRKELMEHFNRICFGFKNVSCDSQPQLVSFKNRAKRRLIIQEHVAAWKFLATVDFNLTGVKGRNLWPICLWPSLAIPPRILARFLHDSRVWHHLILLRRHQLGFDDVTSSVWQWQVTLVNVPLFSYRKHFFFKIQIRCDWVSCYFISMYHSFFPPTKHLKFKFKKKNQPTLKWIR